MTVPFTQFLRPNGEQKPISVNTDEVTEQIAHEVIAQGGRFTAEVLTTGMVSLACEFDDQDIAIELCDNGPGVVEATDKLIRDSARIIAEEYIT